MTSFVTDEDADAIEAQAVEEHEPEPGVELIPYDDSTEEAVALSEASLALVPPEVEMRALVQLAVTLSAAQLVPRALKDKPNDVLLVLLTARDLGIKLTTALRLCYPIDGQVTVAPKLKLAIIRERKLGKVWPDPENDATQATWYAIRADDPETTFASSYTIEEATTAKLAGKDNWTNYPARMLSWRALGYLMDDAFGEVGAGLYSPDELGAITDAEGHPILDVTEVGPLEGTNEPASMAKARRRREQGPPPGEELAPEEERARLAGRLRALPEGGVDAATELWATAVGLRIADLTVKKAKAAAALIDSMWKRAAAGEWGDWSPPPDDEAPSEAQDAAESAPGPVTAPEGSEAQEQPQGHASDDAGELPPLADVEEVIDWIADLPIGEVRERCGVYGIEPTDHPDEGPSENDWRRILAVRVGNELGLL